MECRNFRYDEQRRLVGDPVDVVSGANTYRILDFSLPGPIPLEWERYYSSAQNDRPRRLGWGHTHGLDHRLHLDADGVRYEGPAGEPVGFPALLADGDEFARSGLILRRRTARVYDLYESGQPAMEFEFHSYQAPAPLVRLWQGPVAIFFRYADTGHLKEILDSRGRMIRVDVDREGRVLGLLLLAATRLGKNRPLIAYEYDEAGNLVRAADAYKHKFSFQYDGSRRLIRRTDRRGYSFHYDYGKDGRCVRSRGEDGLHDTRLRYLPLERTTVVTKADGGNWTYFYDEAGTVTQVIDPYGGKQQFLLGPDDRVAEEVDPNGNVTKVLYDQAGAPVGKLSPRGNVIALSEGPDAPPASAPPVGTCPLEWEYGELLDGASITLPARNDSFLTHLPPAIQNCVKTAAVEGPAESPNGGLPAAAFAGPYPGASEGFVYDELGTLVKESGPGSTFRSWSYDANGNVLRFHDREQHTTTAEYASWNLLRGTIDPLGHEVTYQYTNTGRLAAVTDAGGTESEYTYDLKDRLVRVRRYGVVAEEYRYDQADNVLELLDGKGSPLVSVEIGPGNLTFARRLASGENGSCGYDETGRLVRAATDDLEVVFAYDHFGNRVRDERDGLGVKHRFRGPDLLETVVFDRFVVRYRRRGDGTLVIRDPGGQEHTVRWTDRGLVQRLLSNGSSETAQFDNDGRCLMKAVVRARSKDVVWTRSYSYSPEGDLLTTTDSMAGKFTYSYDAAHRLIGAVLPGGKEQAFRYDRAGNLLHQPGLEDVVIRDGNRLSSVGSDRFEYNDRNHLAARDGDGGATHYFYDSADMLRRCVTERGDWLAQYDALGRRVWKTYRGKRVDYYWDADRLAAEVSDGRVRLYVYAHTYALVPMLFIEYDSLDADPASGKRFFVYGNQVGAPVLVEDESARTVWSARLSPYGVRHVVTGEGFHMPLHFPGHYVDVETGLHYNRYRYYSPELGRYLQSDPIGQAGGLNLYAYTDNPLTRVDVQGLNCPIRPPGTRMRWSAELIAAAGRMFPSRWPFIPSHGIHRAGNAGIWQRGYLALAQRLGHQQPPTPRQWQIALGLGPIDPNFTPRRMQMPPGGISSEDLRNLGAHTGLEHGVAQGSDGHHYITRGSPNSPGFAEGDRPLAHNHPGPTPPSGSDGGGGGDIGQARLQLDPGPYAVVHHDGRVSDFGPDGLTPDTRSSYVSRDGWIDGERHPVDPAPLDSD